MNPFASKYAALAALIALVAAAGQKLAAQGETLIQKVEGEVVLVPGVLSFISSGNASQIGAEVSQIKSSPTDIEAGIEYAVTECAFSSAKAQTLIPLIFAQAEWIAAGVAPTKALIAAL